jgi:hypothetical protein
MNANLTFDTMPAYFLYLSREQLVTMRIQIFFVLFFALVLAGCGGGSSDSAVDDVAPVVTINGDASITLTLGDKYIELGAVAEDDVDGVIDVEISGDVDTTAVGSYSVKYSATDSSGNTATESREVIVEEVNGENVVKKGYLIDSAVEGVAYETDSQSGVTNSEGEYKYKINELVKFSIGGIELGSAFGKSLITPVELTNLPVGDNSSQLNNSLRLIQSLDSDCDASNGISIAEATILESSNMDSMVPETVYEFEQDENLESLLDTVPCRSEWVATEAAMSHFNSSLEQVMASELENIAVITPPGETTPTIAVDSSGLMISTHPRNETIGIAKHVVLTDLNSEDQHVLEYDQDGLVSRVIMSDGTIILFQNQTSESVDVVFANADNGEILEPLRITFEQSLHFAFLEFEQTGRPSSFKATKSSNRSADNDWISVQEVSDHLDNAITSVKFVDEVLKTGSTISKADFETGKASVGLAKSTFKSIGEKAIVKAVQYGVGLDKDQRRAADIVYDLFKCSANQLYCAQAALEGAKSVYELASLLKERTENEELWEQMKKEADAIDSEIAPVVVFLSKEHDGKTYPLETSLTFVGNAKDPNPNNLPITENSLLWYVNGQYVGSGFSYTTSSLKVGTHEIKLEATALSQFSDPVSKSVFVTIEEEEDEDPVIEILNPEDGKTFKDGETITFASQLTGPEDTSGFEVTWQTSFDDRVLGTGNVINVGDLDAPDPGYNSRYGHTITATVKNKEGDVVTSDSVQIWIQAKQQTQFDYLIKQKNTHTQQGRLFFEGIGEGNCGQSDGTSFAQYSETWSFDYEDCVGDNENKRCLFTSDDGGGGFFSGYYFDPASHKLEISIDDGVEIDYMKELGVSATVRGIETLEAVINPESGEMSGKLVETKTHTWKYDNDELVCVKTGILTGTPQ